MAIDLAARPIDPLPTQQAAQKARSQVHGPHCGRSGNGVPLSACLIFS